MDPNTFNNSGFTPLLMAVYLGQHYFWKHAFNWGVNPLATPKKNPFDFFGCNRLTGKGILHYSAFNASLIIMLDRLSLGVNSLEFDENLNLPSFYVPQGHITCRKCLSVGEKELLLKQFLSPFTSKTNLPRQITGSKTPAIRPILRMSSKLNESVSNYGQKFNEGENKVRADLSFNLNQKKIEDPDELFKGLAELPSSTVHRIPLMPSDPSKKLLLGSMRRSETENDRSISKYLQLMPSACEVPKVPPVHGINPIKVSINKVNNIPRPLTLGGQNGLGFSAASNGVPNSDRLTANTGSKTQVNIHRLKLRKLKPDETASHSSSYSSQALKAAAPFTNVSPTKLIGRSSKETTTARVVAMLVQQLHRCQAEFAKVTPELIFAGSTQVRKVICQLLASLRVLECCLGGNFDLSPKGTPFVIFAETVTAARDMAKRMLVWVKQKLVSTRQSAAVDAEAVVFVPNPSENRGCLLELSVGARYPTGLGITSSKVTDDGSLTAQMIVRQILTALGIFIQCMGKMSSFESTFKHRIRNMLDDLKSVLNDSQIEGDTNTFLSKLNLTKKVCFTIWSMYSSRHSYTDTYQQQSTTPTLKMQRFTCGFRA